jgi:hypothetical protein
MVRQWCSISLCRERGKTEVYHRRNAISKEAYITLRCRWYFGSRLFTKKQFWVEQNTGAERCILLYSFFKTAISDSFMNWNRKGDRTIYLLYVNQLMATSLFRKNVGCKRTAMMSQWKKGFEGGVLVCAYCGKKKKAGFKIIPEFYFIIRKSQVYVSLIPFNTMLRR